MTKYGFEAAVSLALLLVGAGLWCRRQRIGFDVWVRLCIAVIPCSLVMSRLLFSVSALGNGDMTSPMQALYFWDGGASITGAFAGAVIAAALVEKGCMVQRGTLLDGIGLGAPLALIVERLSEVEVEMGIGRIVDTEALVFLGSFTDDRHPVFLYEGVFAFVLVLVLVGYATRSKKRLPGDMLLTFMTLYGAAQMLFESLRDDAHMVIYYIRINQIAALIMVVIAFVLWAIRWGKRGAKGWQIALASLVLVLAGVQGVIQEFAVDSNPNLLLEYAIMALCVVVMGGVTLFVRHKANA